MRIVFPILILLLAGCQPKVNFNIQGKLPDKTYDGEQIYLVPLENAVKERVDSVTIQDGAFKFEGIATVPEIFVIRAKPVLRYNLEELLVVKEPGNLTVKLGRSSLVFGTALNDSLQHWKDKKMMFDYIGAELIKQYRNAGEGLKPGIQQKSDSLHIDAMNFHFNFVRNNKDDIVGQFVLKIMAGSFTPEQKVQLNLK